MPPAVNPPICPTCGAAIPANAPDGLCPRCLLLGGGMDDDGELPTIVSDDGPALESIGPYRLLEPLGEGGMGTVYVAEQREPIRRKVALKIVKPGMDSREVLARFEAERQALALMDHPHIATVLDAGETELGRPYFVMELVKGAPITEFCDRERLGLPARLELFREVCEAVQHAHQKGIIHRDLKPSNILVAKDGEGGRPVPKIIDFGVAKALGPDLVDATLFTVAGQLVGTPEYMSPEQASLDSGDIDTRSDVYALGILLYELLVGCPPLELVQLRKAGLEAVLRAVREKEAPRPSTRLAALARETKTTVAQARCAPPERLTQTLRGDLDLIVAKSLAKERERRYQTAREFAEDLRRYLNHEAVTATPPSPAYLFGKFARRHRTFMSASAAVVVVLIGGIVATSWQSREARRQRDRAEQTRSAAENLVAVMLDDLNEKLSAIGRLDLMEDITRATDDYFEQVPDEQADESTSLLQGRALLNRARVLRSTGDRSSQFDHARQALAIARELVAKQPDDPGALTLFTSCCSHLLGHDDTTDARELIDEQLALAERLMARKERRAVDYWIAADAQLDAITNRSNLFDRAREAISIADEGLARFQGEASILLSKADAYYRLGSNEAELENRVEALEASIAAYREVASRKGTEHARWRRVMARILQRSSWQLHTLGKRKDDAAMIDLATTRQAEALAELEHLVVLSPHDLSLRRSLAIALHNHGKHLLFAGERDEALKLWRRDISQHEVIFERSPGDLVSLIDCLHQVQLMARHLRERGPEEDEAAIEFAQRAVTLLAAFPEDKRQTLILGHKSYSLLLDYLDEIQSKAQTEVFDLPAEWRKIVTGLENKHGDHTLKSQTEFAIFLLASKGLATHALAAGERSESLKWLGKAESSLAALAREQGPDADPRKWSASFGKVARRLGDLYEQCGETMRAAEVRRLVKLTR